MTSGQQDVGQNYGAQQHGEGARPSRARRPLPAHPLFTPVLTIWGALLGGLVTLVLPAGLVLRAAAQIGLGALDGLSQYIVAALGAVAVAAIMLLVGKALTAALRKQENTPAIAALAVRRVRTIDPINELGSSSLDAPVEAMPFSAAAPKDEGNVGSAAKTSAAPLSLDLAEFAAMPGRNGVWVEEQPIAEAPEAAVEFEAPVEAVPEPFIEAAPESCARAVTSPVSLSAIERLRAVPTSELSLIQMVERFAAALQQHQSTPRGRADITGHEAALAEAIRALAALGGESEGTAQSAPLHAALSRLQELRGAA